MDEDNKDKFDYKEEDTLKSDQENQSENDSTDTLNPQETDNNESEKSNENDNLTENSETLQSQDESVEQNVSASNTNNEEQKKEHEVIHKKDGRLHIYVRQDKYKGELKSRNWVGRLYIDGKQKISSSGTTNLDDAIPILEKWFDDVHEESKKLKIEENIKPEEGESSQIDISTTNQSNNEALTQTSSVPLNENSEISTQDQVKSKLSNIFGKIKEIKIKKPDFAKNKKIIF